MHRQSRRLLAEALPIETAGTALESLGSGKDGDEGSMTFGDAGAAYLTGFLDEGGQDES